MDEDTQDNNNPAQSEMMDIENDESSNDQWTEKSEKRETEHTHDSFDLNSSSSVSHHSLLHGLQLHRGHATDWDDQEEHRETSEVFFPSGAERRSDSRFNSETHLRARALASCLVAKMYRARYGLVSKRIHSRCIFRGPTSNEDAPKYTIDDPRPKSEYEQTFPVKVSSVKGDEVCSFGFLPAPSDGGTAEPKEGSVNGSEDGQSGEEQTSDRQKDEATEKIAFLRRTVDYLLYANTELQKRVNVLTERLANDASQALENQERDRARIDELTNRLCEYDDFWAQMEQPFPPMMLPPQPMPPCSPAMPQPFPPMQVPHPMQLPYPSAMSEQYLMEQFPNPELSQYRPW